MKAHSVRVQKEYYKIIQGTIEVEADSQEEAEEQVEELMMTRPYLQTTDPRIKWDEEPTEGMQYIDFSFEIVPQ